MRVRVCVCVCVCVCVVRVRVRVRVHARERERVRVRVRVRARHIDLPIDSWFIRMVQLLDETAPLNSASSAAEAAMIRRES